MTDKTGQTQLRLIPAEIPVLVDPNDAIEATEPETLSFECPSCSVKLTVPVALAGVSGPCPTCGSSITAPFLPGQIPSLPAPLKAEKFEKKEYAMRSMAEPAPLAIETEGDRWGKLRESSGRFVAICCLAVAAVIGSLVFLNWNPQRSEGESAFSRIEIDPALTPPIHRGQLDLGDQAEKEVLALTTNFLNAKTVEDVLPLVRDRARVSPILREKWQPLKRPEWIWATPEKARWVLYKTATREFGVLQGALPDRLPFAYYFVREGQNLVLDWEASNGISSPDFETLTLGAGSKATVRCFISPSDFYTANYPESEFQCYRLTSFDISLAIWGYAKRGDKADAQLARLFSQQGIVRESRDEHRVILKLSRTEDESLKNQWLISEFLNRDWVQD